MNTQILSHQLEYAILCDDVRREDNGKFLIIGVYVEDIRVPVFPYNLALWLWTRMKFARSDDYVVEFRAVGDGDRQLLQIQKVTVKVLNHSKPMIISLARMMLQLQAPGTAIFQWRIAGEQDWTDALSIDIVKAPPNSDSSFIPASA